MEQSPFILHILNGDFALKLWEQCNFQGQSLVWKETYLEGPLPETDDPSLFRQARAQFLSGFTELAAAGIDSCRLYHHLQQMDETVLSLSSDSKLMLWFDRCIFDQTILMRILYLLKQQKAPLPRIFLYCSESNCLKLDDFKFGYEQKLRLLPEDLDAAARAWHFFQTRDARNLRQLAKQEKFTTLPAMKQALLRCADEIPDSDGLTRTQYQILQLVAAKKSSFKEIFTGLDKFEEYPFLGDTACQRYLDDLVSKGLLICEQEYYSLPNSSFPA
ncbi:MAG: DUF1835 domain-containing protein [Lentisphaeria bacterium]|nr:DUF1835 domain-containing protein [Lentisphaeria bacterium]